MTEILSKISLKTWILIVFALALLAKFIGTIIGDIQRSRSESNSLKDEEFGFSSRVKRAFPANKEEKKAELLHQDEFWECDSCGVEFRISNGKTPSVCPSCGKKTIVLPVGMDEDAIPYICSHCGPYVMLDGDDSEACPVCGSKDVEEAAWVMKCPERWVCTGCSQEFIASGTPRQCPHCGERFSKAGGEVDDDISVARCPACGEEIEMMDEQTAEYCAGCGAEIDPG